MNFGKDKKTTPDFFGKKTKNTNMTDKVIGSLSKIGKVSLDVEANTKQNIAKIVNALLVIVFIILPISFVVLYLTGGLKALNLSDVSLKGIVHSVGETNSPASQIYEESKSLKLELTEKVASNFDNVNINTVLNYHLSGLAGDALEDKLLRYAYFLNNSNYDDYLTYKSVYEDIIVKKGDLVSILSRFQYKEVSSGNNIPLGFLYYNQDKNKSFFILKKYKNESTSSDTSVSDGFLSASDSPGCYMFMIEGNYLNKQYIKKLVKSSEVIPYDSVDSEICKALF